jgi:polyphenol oxidase
LANQHRFRYGPCVTEVVGFLDRLNSLPGLHAGWEERVPGLPLAVDRDEAMRHLLPIHQSRIAAQLSEPGAWWRAEQVHGRKVAVVPGSARIPAADGGMLVPDSDGLVTATPGMVLSIHVADCGPIWLADRETGAIGLLHSGKKGTEGNILAVALGTMRRAFGTRPADVFAVLGPCIRPPDYEVDFAADIGRQAARAGVGDYLDCGLNTASDPARFYSYRRELGKTGRMMAWITRTSA